MKSETIVNVSNLTKRYRDFTAVNNVSFEVRQSEIFGFLGPNGAGKTTTIRMLTGLARPTAGTAVIQGNDIRTEMAGIKKRIGVVTEESNLYDELSVADNLRFVGQLYDVPREQRERRINELLKRFTLDSKKDARFSTLSKGMKRKVTIIAALIHSPVLLFLDEPTTGLDVLSARGLHAMIKELNSQGTTCFLTTHYIQEAEQLCGRVAILVDGSIRTVDTPANLIALTNTKTLEDAFIEITGLKEESMLVEKEGKQ